MRETVGALREVPLFTKLNEEELGIITGIGAVKKFRKDRVIFLEGDEFTGFYVILSGSVKVYKLSADGDETVLHVLKPYRSFAEAPVLTGEGVYPACAQALEDSSLLYVPAVEFRRLMEKSPSIAMKISEAFAVRLMELNKKFEQLSASVESRLARFIIGEINANGSAKSPEPFLALAISKKDLAAHLGIAVETLSRTLRKLKDRKIIREGSKKIFVLDLKHLRELSR
ncbi:MAG TPA: Crp/Fnr family transcriptional regulator [Candidatus Kryptobacter bacterium]|nr:Crp/Fnr family transcriptional regulator [Candidatus Kryptobacter bacterium]